MQEKRRGGRPRGVKHPHKVFTYLSDEEAGWLLQLMERRGLERAALLRVLVRDAARRELPPPAPGPAGPPAEEPNGTT